MSNPEITILPQSMLQLVWFEVFAFWVQLKVLNSNGSGLKVEIILIFLTWTGLKNQNGDNLNISYVNWTQSGDNLNISYVNWTQRGDNLNISYVNWTPETWGNRPSCSGYLLTPFSNASIIWAPKKSRFYTGVLWLVGVRGVKLWAQWQSCNVSLPVTSNSISSSIIGRIEQRCFILNLPAGNTQSDLMVK